VVLVTAPSLKVARSLARELVRGRCAACVNLVPGVQSLYRWKGAIQEEPEVLMIAKTDRRRLSRFKTLVAKRHPYEVPEVLVLAVSEGAASYLAWLDSALDG
jgi:periplasmic divalent cation tolerance protein